MEPQKEKYNCLQKLSCTEHKNVPVTFVCISHVDCSKNNLLCMECIDEMNGDLSHQLISVGKFTKYIVAYESQASTALAQTKEMMKNLRAQINAKLNEIQYFLIGNVQNQTSQKNINPEQLREKTKLIARRKLWTRLQKKGNQVVELEKQIKSEIKSTQKNTAEVLDELYVYSKTCFDKLRHQPKIQLTTRTKKRENANKEMQAEKPIQESEKKSEDERNQSSVMSVSEQAFPSHRKSRKSRYRRYAIEQKIKILTQVKAGVDKKLLAKKFKISTSTILRWEKAFQSQMKLMSKITKPNKKPEEIEVNEIKAEQDHL